MKNTKALAKRMMEKAAISAAKLAAGTASANNYHQTKEPANLKKLLKK